MQRTRLSLHSILTALNLDAACLPLLEQAPDHEAFLRANTPDAIYAAIHAIGNILRATPQADQLVEDLEERINIITHKLKFITDESKPQVFFLADVSPVQLINDAYLETVARIAGGVPIGVFSEGTAADVIVAISEKPVQHLLAALPALLAAPEWAQTPAVRQGNVYIINHPDHLRHPGALLADDIEILAEIFHPKQFVFGRDEDAWMKFEVQ